MSATPFRQHLDGMPNIGQGTGWTVRQWEKAPIRYIRVTDLIATNRGGYLDEQRVAHYMKYPGVCKPRVVAHQTDLYVADGHHRVVAAHRRGEAYIRARVMQVGPAVCSAEGGRRGRVRS